MSMRKLLSTCGICTILALLAVCFGMGQIRLLAQTLAPSQKITDDTPAGGKAPAGSGEVAASSNGTAAANPNKLNAEILKELEQMRLRIQELEAQLRAQQGPSAPATVADGPAGNVTESKESSSRNSLVELNAANPATTTAATKQTQAAPAQPEPAAPFAYADWTWLNGNPRNKDVVWDSKFFTPEIRLDANYIASLNHPRDDSLGGSTETFRSMEVQIEQISFGGDFHWDNVHARMLTMAGMFGVTTPRNDASPGRGQWDLRGAYKYFSEANGGYHFNVQHGLNFDAGIFVSYIGLFSYYNFDNWAYQPSFVSSNTPWFFNGVRIQWFPTDKLKIEPWIINGWQSYGRLGSKPGLGGQILWRPKPWLSLVFNNYGLGQDTLGNGNGQFDRSRIHTDNSIQIKYYDKPENFLDRMAFSLTGDLGCEYGGPKVTSIGPQGQTVINNVNCFHNTATSRKQTFAGWMLYNRFWFMKDRYAVTVGGGVMDNPGRYLVLLPPINGADAISGSPYFTQNPGDPFKAWDTSLTFDWMPQQYITFRTEFGYRHANVPYWSGRGGITNGVNGSPSTIPGLNATVIVPGTTFVPGPFLSPTPGFTCVAGTGFCPDLRNDEPALRFAVMVKF